MAAVAGVNMVAMTVFARASEPSPKSMSFSQVSSPWRRSAGVPLRRMCVAAAPDKLTGKVELRRMCVAAAPDKLTGKVEESIKAAEEACAGDAVSGECAAAWDEVEELSAAASHARDKQKDADPLETYCKDNPETNECRTYDN